VHLLDEGAVDLVDLVPQQIHQMLAGKIHHELVDRPPEIAPEDVDGHDVAADRADAARHQAQGAGAVRQPDPDEIAHHTITLGDACERRVSRRLPLPRSAIAGPGQAARPPASGKRGATY
jgi:hypothetical protein